MKKLLLFLSITAVTTMSIVAQVDTNQVDGQGRKQGLWKKYDEKGHLLYEGTFAHDQPVGIFKYYHPNGKLKNESHFLQGTREVQTRLFHPNGRTAALGVFVNQQKDGTWLYYNDKGTLVKEENYKLGEQHGVEKTYSPENGNLLREEVYVDGKLQGLQTTYYTTGHRYTHTPYLNGKREGIMEIYHEDSTLIVRGNYHQDRKTGEWYYFGNKNRVRKSENYTEKGLEKTYLHFYRGTSGQPINYHAIAYLRNLKPGIEVHFFSGNVVTFDDTFDEILDFTEQVDYLQLTPTILMSIDNIRGYKVLNSDEIQVLCKIAVPSNLILSGDAAIMVKSLFRKDMPTLE
ncbi:MAG: hypothetical protein LBR51_01850 [Bacteroidales bacterium]|nr:hypothetical protein [Bacteroidales bacterium]